MVDDRASGNPSVAEQLEDLQARMTQNRADIRQLMERADASEERADAFDRRADVTDERAEHERLRVDDLGERLALDQALIEELRAEGLLKQAQVHNLQAALRTSRTIGAAMGMVMTHRKVDETVAFQILQKASQDSNTKLRSFADGVVATGDVGWLPTG